MAKARLVCVGRICEQKGQLLLVESIRLLADRGIRFELVFAGDGEMRAQVEALVEHHGLGNSVRITGWINGDQVMDEISAARALVLPSFAEGLPVVIMEAMALRRPVISTFVAGIPELVQSGQHGWLVPAGDVEALATAIESCLNANPETIAEIGDRACIRVRERHDIDIEAAKLSALFEEYTLSQARARP
jgi:glycosyltransferase involved in cell wall biosynthesis